LLSREILKWVFVFNDHLQIFHGKILIFLDNPLADFLKPLFALSDLFFKFGIVFQYVIPNVDVYSLFIQNFLQDFLIVLDHVLHELEVGETQGAIGVSFNKFFYLLKNGQFLALFVLQLIFFLDLVAQSFQSRRNLPFCLLLDFIRAHFELFFVLNLKLLDLKSILPFLDDFMGLLDVQLETHNFFEGSN